MCLNTDCDTKALIETANKTLQELISDEKTKFEVQPDDVVECSYFQFTTYNRFLYRELRMRSHLIDSELGFYPDWMGLERYKPKHIKVFFDIKTIDKLEEEQCYIVLKMTTVILRHIQDICRSMQLPNSQSTTASPSPE